jgi:hypothetical protein
LIGGDFLLPVNTGGHTAYQNTFVSEFLALYPNPFAVPKETWDVIVKFWYLDLSEVDTIMLDYYSFLGKPASRLPSCLLRSYLLSIKLGVTSITKWCGILKVTPLYALLSGFSVHDTPGVGTFYDFFNRLWQSDRDNYLNQIKHKRVKPQKGRKHGDKTPCDTNSAASKLLPLLERFHLPNNNPFYLVFRLYKEQFLDKSIERGLISPGHLSLAGDGSPIETARLEHSKRICKCEKGSDCKCKRRFSQPDCSWGWDSSRDRYFFGYHLYMFVASDSENDLPVFPLLERASRHDMLSFLHTFFSMKSYLPEFRIEKLLLDSAHDSYPLYDYCKSNGITAFIDLNPGHSGHYKYKDDFTIADDGVPVCQMGLRMHHDGVEKAKHREKYRCPLFNRKYGCKCEHPCSDAKYGRTVHLQQNDNPRLFNIPPRDSKEWKLEYSKRTSVERSNKREKIDYKLEGGRHRSSKMWYCRLYAIMMLQHLDAWKMPTRVDTIFTFSRIATTD